MALILCFVVFVLHSHDDARCHASNYHACASSKSPADGSLTASIHKPAGTVDGEQPPSAGVIDRTRGMGIAVIHIFTYWMY